MSTTDLAKAHGLSVREVGYLSDAASAEEGARRVGVPISVAQAVMDATRPVEPEKKPKKASKKDD